MNRWWRPRSVRVRLTLWHVAALAVVLVLYAGGVFVFLRQSLIGDLDRQLREDLERSEETFSRNADGTLAWSASDPDAEPTDPAATEGPWACAWDPDGRLLYRHRFAPPPVTDPVRAADVHGDVFRTVHSPDGRWIRELTGLQDDVAGRAAIVRVARSEAHVRHELGELLLILGFGLPLALLAAGVGGYLVARRALAPIGRMAGTARRITAARLADRLPVDNPDDELGHLASVFNDTFGRLEASFDQLRRFTADASHEMRTPLTAIRTVGEVGLQEPRTDRAYREIVGSMLEEADRMGRLVESLLTLARADGGHAALALERVDLSALAAEVVEHLAVLAEDKHQAIELSAAAPVFVEADRLLLRQAVINLVDNAIKYSPVDGRIRIGVSAAPPHAILAVADSGPGVAPEHRDHIFDRFYRADRGRSREAGGFGLGLSIARWAVEVQGGRLELQQPETSGSVFRIVLPMVPSTTAGRVDGRMSI